MEYVAKEACMWKRTVRTLHFKPRLQISNGKIRCLIFLVQTNCRYKCVEWGVAMEIGGNVRREAVEGRIKEAVDGEKGREMKKRAVEWREAAVQSKARSLANLDALIDDVLLSGKNAIVSS